MRQYKSKPKIEFPKPPIDNIWIQVSPMSNKGWFSLVCWISWIITKSYILDMSGICMSGDIGYTGYMSEDDVKPWDLLNPNAPRSQEELAEYRLEICKGCPWFRERSQTCKKCGCFMKLKTTLKNAKCPVGKW